MSPAGRARPLVRERIAQGFTQAEDVLYVGIGVMLALGAVSLLVNAGATLARSVGAGAIGGSIVGLLDQLLLILMMIGVLYTVQVSFREHVLVPEPFVLVAMIAAMRRILVLTAEFGADGAARPDLSLRDDRARAAHRDDRGPGGLPGGPAKAGQGGDG